MKATITILLTTFTLTANAAHTIYSFCNSVAYKMPDQMKKTMTLSSCFKATSIMDKDAPNIAANFCRGWAKDVGLALLTKDSRDKLDLFAATDAQVFGKDTTYMTSLEACEAELADRMVIHRRNSVAESAIGETKPIMVDLYNGIVPSKVTATKFSSIRFFCETDSCWDKQ